MATVALVVAVVAIILVSLWFYKSSQMRKMVNKVPGPPTLPVIGNAHQLTAKGADFFGLIMRLSEEFKDSGMYRIWLGTAPMVVLYKAEFYEEVMGSTRHMDKSFLYQFVHPWLGTGLLTSNGRKWHGRRKMLTPTFHFKILSDFVPVFNEQSQILTEKLRSKVGDKPFNIFPYITLCALDIICETAMGKKLNAQNNGDSEYVTAVNRMSSIVINRMKAPWFWPDILFNSLGEGAEHNKYLHILHSFTQQVINEKRSELGDKKSSSHLDEGKKRLAFMDLLLRMSEDAQGLSDDDIREEVDTFMFEGHDTTAAAMNWAVYLIGSHPNVQQKVHEEMDTVFGDSDRTITIDDLKDLHYTECCIKEALRLYPSVPMFGRSLTQDAEIGSCLLPKGTTILLLASALHRDAGLFPDPDVFNPDRFLPDNANGRHPYAYVPFSAGMRNCIGQKFALMEEKVVIANIFRHFHVKSHQNKDDLKPVGDLVLRPENGIIVSITNRN